MGEIEFIGKCLLIEIDGEKILVIGDLHLGYQGVMREGGVLVPGGLYEKTIKDMDEVFEFIKGKESVGGVGVGGGVEGKNKKGGKIVDKVILLGDLKHEFGKTLKEEWKEVLDFIDYLQGRAKEIVIVKGNHDAVIEGVVRRKDIKVVDYYLLGVYAFLHGDKDFEEIHSKEVGNWVVGHGHPAVILEDGTKTEKYKCFLVGKYKGRQIVIVPSFFDLNEGSDPRDYDLKLGWDLNLGSFDVRVVGEGMRVLDFGKLKDL
jgi:uncharacterized protein